MKNKTLLYEIVRWAAALVGVVMLVMMFASNDSISNADPTDVQTAVEAKLDMSKMMEGDTLMIRRLYGLNPDDYESCTLYYPSTNMVAEELLIIKLADVSQQDTVQAAIESRLETQKITFDGYGVEQYDMLTNNSVIEIQGNYVLFVVSDTSAEAKQAFVDAL